MPVDTLYFTEEFINGNETSLVEYIFPNQTTGTNVITLMHSTTAIHTAPVPMLLNGTALAGYSCRWRPELLFSTQDGTPSLVMECLRMDVEPPKIVAMDLTVSIHDISSILASYVRNDTDRFFVILRNREGTLLGSSHGKWFSHSDIDYSANIPLLNPPPVNSFQTYNPTECTDVPIRTIGTWLLWLFQSWDAIPYGLDAVMDANGMQYHVTSMNISAACQYAACPFPCAHKLQP